MTDERLKLADEYEAGLRKMEAAGYEEFGPTIEKHKLVIAALRATARPELPLAVRLRDEEGPPLPQMVAQRRATLSGPPQTATREALEEINALISNGDRPTVNERNAFEHFTTLNRLLLNIRDIARRALSLVPSTTRGACHDHPTKRCTPDDCCQPVTL